MCYKSPKEETEEGLKMLQTNKDAMEMGRIGLRDNMVELFVVHKDGATTRKGCTIEEVHEIDGGEADQGGKKPKVVTEAQTSMLEEDFISAERSDSSGDDESKDYDYQPENDDGIDKTNSDEQWSENSSEDSAMEVTFDDSDDDWNGDGGLYDVDITTMKDSQKMKQSVPTERVQGEFSASVTTGNEKVVAVGLRDEDDRYESEELWDVPVSDDEGDPSLRKYHLHKNLKNMKKYKWEIGTMYVASNAFKECVTSYAVHSGRGVWFSKCDSHRCRTVCQEGYKWFAYCHKMKREDTW
ncbi:hypothetical protein Ahy_B03g064536 [Arachis hypogaea]|uniref:Transposase MuDR plant domain-containing protein n=1 Tax=Arachis hypogaea TaxID=3818 RepID=A0A444ZZQ8_ARAHY|nr:hypothetical protein Ahy_B03g064536 [Arachis hypogaea]